MQQCNITSNLSSEKPKYCRPLDLNVLIVTLSNRYHAHLEPLKKIDPYARLCYKFHLSEFPPLLSSFISLCPTQGHPFEISGTHSNKCLHHGFKVLQQKFPFPNAYWFLHPLSSTAQTSFVFIIPQHQPLMSFILP
jgi:hypothetical protein